ncbi:MAG: ribonuclease III [Rhodospirillaceae bacterium]
MTAADGNADRLGALEAMLGHRFKDQSLLRRALAHASSKSDRLKSNERMEFLGDRVLGLCVAKILFARYPNELEGDLGYRFTGLVNRDALAEIAGVIGLGPYITVSTGEASTGGQENPSILADACEAVIGAIFLDGGFDPAFAFVSRAWEDMIRRQKRPEKDPKTRLQELCQKHDRRLPQYTVVDRTGPDHQPEFRVRVAVDRRPSEVGAGTSKQAAEQAAAVAMLAAWESEGGGGA